MSRKKAFLNAQEVVVATDTLRACLHSKILGYKEEAVALANNRGTANWSLYVYTEAVSFTGVGKEKYGESSLSASIIKILGRSAEL